MLLPEIAEALLLTTSLVSASLIKLQTPPSPATVYKDTSWIETTWTRSNGDILVNHWTNLNSGPSTPQPNQQPTSSHLQTQHPPPESLNTHPTNSPSPYLKSVFVKQVPESNFWIGITPFGNDTVFIAEAGKGSIYKITLSTGEYSIVLTDLTMKAATGSPISEGVHGIVYHAGYLYYTSTFGVGFYKVKIDPVTGKLDGKVIPITTVLGNPERLAVAGDGTSYVCDAGKNVIIKVDERGKVGNVTSAQRYSSVAFGRRGKDKNTFYILTNGRAVLSTTIS
ncbi:uncharacterized protein PAC_10153 [Phialocephala subalpina]|uniref:SMP-30/Gluconolactonase/LRE-like region domain-containing protein n=1 Tax=Phialocephala subalpina TaxID=576137 RepID=A0A1L7X5H6_9HELO|nr:uncharacterized protein PAC_10153 [Phialocephala subalpina]